MATDIHASLSIFSLYVCLSLPLSLCVSVRDGVGACDGDDGADGSKQQPQQFTPQFKNRKN